MTKFINIANPDDKMPNIVNVDDIVRIRPGLVNNGFAGKDKTATLYMRLNYDEAYDTGSVQRDIYCIEVHLSTAEICRRLLNEILTI